MIEKRLRPEWRSQQQVGVDRSKERENKQQRGAAAVEETGMCFFKWNYMSGANRDRHIRWCRVGQVKKIKKEEMDGRDGEKRQKKRGKSGPK